jgi:CIC family chloride channel protein
MSFLVLELTRNVDVTAAALAASVITSVCVRATFGHSFSTWRLHLRGENVRGGMDIGWGHSLKVERLMRTDHKIIEKSSTIAKCREKFVLGSCQAVFVVDAAERYLGTIMLSDLFSEKHDATADVQQVGDLVTTGTIMLRTDTSLSAAMMLFDESLAEVLAVSDLSQDRCIVGFLTETFTRRRYLQEFEQATKGVFGFR